MLVQIIVFLLLFTVVFAATELQANCTGTDRAYNGSSCFVLNATQVHYSKAKLSCEHYLGYSGHLAFIRSSIVANTLKKLMTTNGVSYAYVGNEKTNTSTALTADWVYAYPNGSTTPATYLSWYPGYPRTSSTYDRAPYAATSTSGIWNVDGEDDTYAYVCEYEESLKQTVTDLEIKCAASTKSHVYNNGHCYIYHDETPSKNYFAAKLSCRDISGINGHLIHLRNAANVQMVETMMKAQPAWNYVKVGLEQTNASAPDTKTPGSWFYTTPQDSSEMATYLPWAPAEPNNGTTAQFGYYSNLTHGICDDVYSYPSGYICEYESSRQMTTDLEPLCDATGVNQSLYNVATPDGHCYIMHPTTKSATAAKLACTDIPGYKGHLIHIRNSTQRRIVENLINAASYSYAWIGLEYKNVTGTNRSTGWFYATPEDNSELATYIPWYSTNPTNNAGWNNARYYVGNSNINGNTGGIQDYPSSSTYQYICDYDCVNGTTWTSWSQCSQSCDNGIRTRMGKIYNVSASCMSSTPTYSYEYESCTTGVECKSYSTRTTSLKSDCLSTTGSYFAYSTCYFIANITGSQAAADTYCQSVGGKLASLFGEDLVSQLGSLFLQVSSVQAWIDLQYTGSNFKWLVDSIQYPVFKNLSAPPAGSNCVALVSDKTSPNATNNLRLSSMPCSVVLNQAICMKSDHIYSSYIANEGKKVVEDVSAESTSTEYNFYDCSARCSKLIGCVGFNFSPSDGSCIPTKVSLQMPSTINGVEIYTVEDDSAWNYYDRT